MKLIAIIVVMGIGVGSALAGQTTDRLILLDVRQCDNPWGENRLESKIQTALTREPGWRVEPVGASIFADGQSATWIPTDSMVALGRDKGGQYLLTFVVNEQRLERRKSFHVPLVFHKWETVAVMTGEYRIIDLLRGRPVKAEQFEYEVHGPRAIQATMDDTKFDPDITMTATEKTKIFDDLEQVLIKKLLPKVKPILAKGDRETYARQEAHKRP